MKVFITACLVLCLFSVAFGKSIKKKKHADVRSKDAAHAPLKSKKTHKMPLPPAGGKEEKTEKAEGNYSFFFPKHFLTPSGTKADIHNFFIVDLKLFLLQFVI